MIEDREFWLGEKVKILEAEIALLCRELSRMRNALKWAIDKSNKQKFNNGPIK